MEELKYLKFHMFLVILTFHFSNISNILKKLVSIRNKGVSVIELKKFNFYPAIIILMDENVEIKRDEAKSSRRNSIHLGEGNCNHI